jgi:hypothetical protein
MISGNLEDDASDFLSNPIRVDPWMVGQLEEPPVFGFPVIRQFEIPGIWIIFGPQSNFNHV